MSGTYVVPAGMVLIGTCGNCGGPVLSPQFYGSTNTNDEPPAACGQCGRSAKPKINPAYGPILEMK